MPALLLAALFFSGCSSRDREKAGAGASPAAEPQGPAVLKAPEKPERVSRKLLLFGVDGATWTLIDPLLKAGKMPNFRKLIDEGVRAPLMTFKPTVSPLLWTTIATGFGPRIHGIDDFVAKVPGTGETLLVTSNMRKVKALWNILSEADHTVGVVGWWATYPAEKVNGFVISDQAVALRKENYEAALDIPSRHAEGSAAEAIYPPDLGPEIGALVASSPEVGLQHLGRFMALPEKRLAKLRREKKVDVEDIFSIFGFALRIDQEFAVGGAHAIKRFDPDFTAFYLSGLDHGAEHSFWKYIEPDRFKAVEKISQADVDRYGKVIENYYLFMDELLGRLLALYRKEDLTVMIVSDHGHEANVNYDPRSRDHYNRVCSGDHEVGSPDGILVLSGKDIAPGALFERQPNIGDIVPTVLALMGVPVGSDMKGRVLKEAIAPAFLKAHPVAFVPTHSAGYAHGGKPVPSPMSQELLNKLKGIGYVQ